MKVRSFFIILTIFCIPLALGMMGLGIKKIVDSGYILQHISHGFIFSLLWIMLGGIVFFQWFIWFCAHLFTFIPTYDIEQLMFNFGLIIISVFFFITGLIFMDTHPLYLNVCECDSGFYGIDCTPCPSSNFRGLGPCSGHGTCDENMLR